MLNKLFNYLKSKHLPSSIAAKNRLYLERDMKNRRILTNFGSTFRNSKWSDYSITNVNLKHKSSLLNFFKTLIIIILAIAIFYSYSVYTNTWLLNIVLSYIASFYSFVYIWYLYVYLIVPLLIKTLFTYAWESVFKTPFNSTSSDLAIEHNFQDDYTTVYPDTNIDYSLNLQNHYFFTKSLYNSIKQLNYISSLTNDFNQSMLFNSNIHSVYPIQSSNLFKDITNGSNTSKLTWFNKTGLFYINNSDWHFLSTTLMNMVNRSDLASTSLNQQLANVKTLRWTYRYNMLHRHVLRGSTQLTSTKKLLSPGFLDSTSSKKNIWFSDNYSDILSSNYSNYLRVLYPSLYNSSSQSFNSSSSSTESLNKFLLINSYETSFYFYLKRIFSFTNLQAQELHSTRRLNNSDTNSLISSNDPLNINVILKLMLPKSLYLTNGLFNPLNKQFTIPELLKKNVNTYLSKDVTLITWEWDLLLTEQLDCMLNLSSTLPSSNGAFYTSTYTTYKPAYDPTTDMIIDFRHQADSTTTSFNCVFNTVNFSIIDSILLNDLLLLSLINKR